MKKVGLFILCVVGCEFVGLAGTPFTISSIPSWYTYLDKPFFAPPNWLFGPVWTLLYFLMGVSLYLIVQKGKKEKKVKTAIKYFLVQLGLNFIWSPIFFGLRSPALGLIIIVSMWIAIVATIRKFNSLSQVAAFLLIPYLLWVSFATLLNAGIVYLN